MVRLGRAADIVELADRIEHEFAGRRDAVSGLATVGASEALARPEEVREMPPALILVCGGSLHGETVSYVNTPRAAGVEVRLQEYTLSAHGFTYFKPNANSNDAIARMGACIREKSGALN